MALILSKEDIANNPDFLTESDRYGRVLCVPVTETDLVNITNSTSKTALLLDAVFGGNDNGEFIVYHNSTEFMRYRNAWTDRARPFPLGARKLLPGESFRISVINKGALSEYFEATLNAKES